METTLLQEEKVGKAGRREQGREEGGGRREGKPEWFVTFGGCISHMGICLGRALLCTHLQGAQH